MGNIILAVLVVLWFSVVMVGTTYNVYTCIRDDIRTEKKRKKDMKANQ